MLNGGQSISASYAHEVHGIIRSLEGNERRAVRFREIWPRLALRERHPDDATWQRLTTERALKLLCGAGWIERTIDGYRNLDSPLFPFYAVRVELGQVLDLGADFVKGAPAADADRARIRLDGPRAERLTIRAGRGLGAWFRSIDEKLSKRAAETGSPFGAGPLDSSPTSRAAAIARSFVDGYLYPEYHAAEETTTGAPFPSFWDMAVSGPGGVARWWSSVKERAGTVKVGGREGVRVPDFPPEKVRAYRRKRARSLAPLRAKVLRSVARSWKLEERGGLSPEEYTALRASTQSRRPGESKRSEPSSRPRSAT